MSRLSVWPDQLPVFIWPTPQLGKPFCAALSTNFGHFMQLLPGSRQPAVGRHPERRRVSGQNPNQKPTTSSLHAQQIFTRFSQRLEKRLHDCADFCISFYVFSVFFFVFFKISFFVLIQTPLSRRCCLSCLAL